MDLSQEQLDAVKQWVEAGAGLSEVQQRLSEEFGISMTYMDVRFLVDDVGAELKDADKPAEPQPKADDAGAGAEASAAGEPEVEDPDVLDFDDAAGAGGAVKVEVDKVMRPGAIVSGSVTFSDGVTAGWQLDQMGRLGIVPPNEGYQPPADDIQDFQVQLQQVLQQQGY